MASQISPSPQKIACVLHDMKWQFNTSDPRGLPFEQAHRQLDSSFTVQRVVRSMDSIFSHFLSAPLFDPANRPPNFRFADSKDLAKYHDFDMEVRQPSAPEGRLSLVDKEPFNQLKPVTDAALNIIETKKFRSNVAVFLSRFTLITAAAACIGGMLSIKSLTQAAKVNGVAISLFTVVIGLWNKCRPNTLHPLVKARINELSLKYPV